MYFPKGNPHPISILKFPSVSLPKFFSFLFSLLVAIKRMHFFFNSILQNLWTKELYQPQVPALNNHEIKCEFHTRGTCKHQEGPTPEQPVCHPVPDTCMWVVSQEAFHMAGRCFHRTTGRGRSQENTHCFAVTEVQVASCPPTLGQFCTCSLSCTCPVHRGPRWPLGAAAGLGPILRRLEEKAACWSPMVMGGNGLSCL